MYKDIIYETPMAEKYKVHDLACPVPPHKLPPEYIVEPHCDCHHHHPVPPPPPYPYPYPFPAYPYPPMPKPEDVPTKVPSVENELCKLSKKASIIVRMINNFETNKKDAIVKIGEVSYNFGPYKKKDEEGEEKVTLYGEEILEMLKLELEAIKTKIGELATEIGDGTSTLTTTYGEVESSVYNS